MVSRNRMPFSFSSLNQRMFKKYDFAHEWITDRFYPDEFIISKSQVKASAGRGIRKAIIEQYPEFEKYADELFPKKENVVVAKWLVSFCITVTFVARITLKL